MDKVKVNNQVISMKKYVKMAKVRIIHKLTKDIRSLELKKGTDLQLKKNKRKSERLLSEIMIMKKINVDVVSRRALLKEKDWNAVLSSKETSLEDRAFAMLASYEAVQKEVEKFHAAEPELVSLLPNLFKEWDSRKSNPKAKHFKGLKASEFRKLKKDKSNQNKQKSPKATQGQNGEEHNSSRRKTESKNYNLDDADDSKLHEETMASVSGSEADQPKPDLCGKVSKTSEFVSKSNLIKKNEMAVFSLDLDDLADREAIPSDKDSEIPSDEDSEDEDDSEVGKQHSSIKEKDPFFASPGDLDTVPDVKVGKKLLSGSYSGDELSDTDSPSFSVKRPPPPKRFSGNQRTKAMQFTKGNKSASGQHRFGNKGRFDHKPVHNEFNRNNSNRFSRKHENVRTKRLLPDPAKAKKNIPSYSTNLPKKSQSESLHPSWEAKKKLKQSFSIVPAQGKRIKFDD